MHCTLNALKDINVILFQELLLCHFSASTRPDSLLNTKWVNRLTISLLTDEDEYAADTLEIFVKPILKIPSHRGL